MSSRNMTSAVTVCCALLLLCLLSQPALGQDVDLDCVSDCSQYGVSLFCSCQALSEDLSAALIKRGGAFPFRYGKRDDKRQMPFRYGKRSLDKRQFRYGKRMPATDRFGYIPHSASAYNRLSSIAEEN